MTITLPTQETIFEDLQSYLHGLVPEISTSPDTDEGARLKMLTLAIYGLYYELKQIEADIFPQTAATAALDVHASIRLPDGRKSATISSGAAAIRVRGTLASTVSIGDTLVHTDGTRYKLTEAGTIPAGLYVDLGIESISTGLDTNKEVGDELSFESPPSGIETIADVVVSFTGGTDQETDGELLQRLLQAFQNPPAGGRASDYWAWAMAVDGCEEAFVYCPSSTALTGRRGLGVADVAILKEGTGSARIPGSDLVLEVQDAIDEDRPCTASDSDVLTPAAVTNYVEVRIEPLPGYEWDWLGAGGYLVNTWTEGTRTLVSQHNVSGIISAGDRIMSNGELRTVESVSSYDIVVTEAFTAPGPVHDDGIYPGGPLSLVCQQAIKDYFDTLGPARGDAPDPGQFWEDTYRQAKMIAALCAIPGVRDVEVIAPVATSITPTDHAPSGTVDLEVYGEICVRSA